MSIEGPLRADGLALTASARPVDEVFRSGEIVGLAGLEGHGQDSFLEVLAGLRQPAIGQVLATMPDGRTIPVRRFSQAVRCGIAYLPRDRRAHGIFPALSILDNFGIVSLATDTRFGLLSFRRRQDRFQAYRERLSIVAPRPGDPITTLSGGNQQKVLLARWLARGPRLLLLNDPTRGVDQRTRETLYEVFLDLARREKMSIVVLSTEIKEILRICDRALVFRDQAVASRLSGAEMTSENVISAMFGR
jgi:ribose transport system ATP-binding protein